MRVSREQAELNRQKVIESASKLFRERGIDGIGVSDLMKDVGLTHGGFYRQFTSKNDLVIEAARHAMAENAKNRDSLFAAAPNAWEAFVENYLSRTHCDHPSLGCVFSALSVDASRRDEPLKNEFTKGLEAYIEQLVPLVPETEGWTARDRAIAVIASMMGAVVLARAVDDQELSQDVLNSVKKLVT